MNVDPGQTVYFEWGIVKVTATLVYTWITMAILSLGSYMLTRRLSAGRNVSGGQTMLEALMETMESQIREISRQDSRRFIPFVGTLFLFILFSNLLSVVPGFRPPTGSLNTTIALSICVFLSVPFFGIRSKGVREHLKSYLKPTPLMLPFNIIGEISRTVSLAVRLYGNVMSSSMIVAILLTIVPLVFPVVMQVLGLLTGVIQAYIFAILAIVYISSAAQVPKRDTDDSDDNERRK